ncbi:hypothetical protein LKO27_12330 [Tessaracoccus sp. OS52]|uniref:hypothetical protein n=1 Tax=Tessaracoccus sp. OS52 TaxID=2886691 RepID=UPI001D104FD3|nr:hypothetical protein [Tessaracoccus sp. OS52]MCC2594194.1 hypothetical protein [Tessaracoccus sp. OS52]
MSSQTRTRRLPVAGLALATLAAGFYPLLPVASHAAEPRAFYVDADGGSDSNSGLSPDSAWATVEKVNATDFEPGDQILFQAGDTWTTEGLVIDDSGQPGAPIVVGSYDDGTRPRLDAVQDGVGITDATVLVHNAEYVEVRNLELTNDAETGGQRNGLLVLVDQATQDVYSNYVVDNVYIHDVKGLTDTAGDGNDGKKSGGIGFYIGTGFKEKTPDPSKVTRFDSITLTDNVVRKVDQTGLWLESDLRNGTKVVPGSDTVYKGYSWADSSFTNVDVGYNEISDTGKNAVIMRMMHYGRFHHNEVFNTTDRVPVGNSVFTSSVYGTVIEWNEVHHNLGHGHADGAALDADIDSPETQWRYNYTHDNNYGLITICTRKTDAGVDVYQNIDIAAKGRLINVNFSHTEVNFFNNAFWVKPVPEVEYPETHPEYVNPDRAQTGGYPQLVWETYLRDEWWGRDGHNYTYKNNTIYNEADTATFYLNPNDETSVQISNRDYADNTFYGLWPDDGTGEQIRDSFTMGGQTPPEGWIADTVGSEVADFWAPSIAGEDNPFVGPRSDEGSEFVNLKGNDRFFVYDDGARVDRVKASYTDAVTGEVEFYQVGDHLVPARLVTIEGGVGHLAVSLAEIEASPVVGWKAAVGTDLESEIRYHYEDLLADLQR